MKIHQIIPVSSVNGFGKRFVIWVQGCSRNCPECFNPATHDKNSGKELTIKEIIQKIPITEDNLCEVCGITISGGEPFEQAEELTILLEELGKLGLNRLVYTGYTFEELTVQNDKTINKCLSLTDILIDGSYKKEIPPKLPWIGSGNQRILGLKKGKIDKIYNETDFDINKTIDSELIIDPNGNIFITGNEMASGIL